MTLISVSSEDGTLSTTTVQTASVESPQGYQGCKYHNVFTLT